MVGRMRGRVLIVAGSDSGGGAGIQADIKTVAALGGFAMTAITALTAQNTLGVHGVMPVPADFVRLQIDCVLDDLGADAFKIGMLGDAALIEAVAERLGRRPDVPLVLDPVMVAKGGQRLLAEAAIAALKRSLLPLASVLTPNVPEAEALCGMRIGTEADSVMPPTCC
jgi:hydroxymethylpyrimidine/phosphomethylpyrimidine kinase